MTNAQLDAEALARATAARDIVEDRNRREGEAILRRKLYQRTYQKSNREYLRDMRRKKALEDPRGPYSRYRLGVDATDFKVMLAAQQWLCAVCGKSSKHWHLDHDHKTDRVRAVLCASCNKGLGHFRDQPDLLRAAALYIELHSIS